MLTVAELAKELSVSNQTVYRALNSVEQDSTECLTEKIKGTRYFTDVGERLVRERLTGVEQKEGECSTPLNSVEQTENSEILFLREQNKALLQELEREREHNRAALEREREHSREQTNKLSDLTSRVTDLASQIAELSRNNQILLGAEQSRTNPVLLSGERTQPPDEPAEPPPKESLFKRIFGKK